MNNRRSFFKLKFFGRNSFPKKTIPTEVEMESKSRLSEPTTSSLPTSTTSNLPEQQTNLNFLKSKFQEILNTLKDVTTHIRISYELNNKKPISPQKANELAKEVQNSKRLVEDYSQFNQLMLDVNDYYQKLEAFCCVTPTSKDKSYLAAFNKLKSEFNALKDDDKLQQLFNYQKIIVAPIAAIIPEAMKREDVFFSYQNERSFSRFGIN